MRPAMVDEVLEEVHLALLEADVNLNVANAFVARVREAAVGEELDSALDAQQQVIKILNQELTLTLGGESAKLEFDPKSLTVILMVGLQGTGKTTASAKLAAWLKGQGKRPLLVGADLQRPAALEQLRVLASEIDVPVVCEGKNPKAVAQNALKDAKKMGRNVLICDTAGRISIDAELMDELSQINKVLEPHHILFVADSMAGQDALGVAEDFSHVVDLNGVILTKLDGDARGGAALSVREIVGSPIYFASTGERIIDFEVFHPDRLSGRILGMGDILTLIEKTEAAFEQEEMKSAEQAVMRMLEGRITMDDFLNQMRVVQKMGMGDLAGNLPDSSELGQIDLEAAEQKLNKLEAIICSMTLEERIEPEKIDSSRRRRIAAGSGSSPTEVSALVREFLQIRKQMKKPKGMDKLISRLGL